MCKKSPLLLFAAFAFTLSACSHFPPEKAAPSSRAQCVAIKHQQLTLSLNKSNKERAELQTEQHRLAEAYHKMNCDKILKK